MKETMWGIDLGGTKVEGIILRGDKEPETLVRTRVDTEAAQGYDHVIGQIEKLVNKMKAAGILVPGTTNAPEGFHTMPVGAAGVGFGGLFGSTC